jgi:hypothetical protein
MKIFLFILVSSPALLFAQNNQPIANFYLENNTIVYRHVFKDSLDSASVIERKLISRLPVSPVFNNVKQLANGKIITGTYESQSTNEGAPWEMIKGYFIIEIKNGRYRVTISNIIDNKNTPFIPFTYLYSKNNPIEWRNGVQKDLAKLDEKFTAAFGLDTPMQASDW